MPPRRHALHAVLAHEFAQGAYEFWARFLEPLEDLVLVQRQA